MSRKSTRVRDAGTGRFVPAEEAARRPKSTVKETLKIGPVKKRK